MRFTIRHLLCLTLVVALAAGWWSYRQRMNHRSLSWTVLGLNLTPTKTPNSKFHGGMSVVDVRSGSPAEEGGIRSGDVLVGLHIWETVSSARVDYVLNRPDFGEHAPVKFYILRGSQTLYGQMPVPLGR